MNQYTDLIERLRGRYPRTLPALRDEATAALAALVKERDAALARVKRLEDALRGLLAFEPEHCPCGEGSCAESKDGWGNARAALAGDKP